MLNSPLPVSDVRAEIPDATVAQLWGIRAARDPDHIYCTYEGEDWTIGRMHQRSNRIANGLLGVSAEASRVAVMLPNDPEYAAVIFALAKAGLVRIPVNVHLKDLALDFIFSRFEPQILIADLAYKPALEPILPGYPDVEVIWRDARAPENCQLNLLAAAAGAHAPET